MRTNIAIRMLDANFSEFLRQKNIRFFKTIHSTQSYAVELSSKSKPIEKTAILTYNQTDGKGQLGAKWQTQAEKNICMSFICYPTRLIAGQQFLLSMTAALAVYRFLKQYSGGDISIKWPNDLLIDRKKLCGILINNSLQGAIITSSVIGIGVNVNQADFDEELLHATSLLRTEGREFDLDELALALYDSVSDAIDTLNEGHYELIRSQYHKHLFGMNEKNRFIRRDLSEFEGEIAGVDEDGRLLVNTVGGLEKFDIRDIKPIL